LTCIGIARKGQPYRSNGHNSARDNPYPVDPLDELRRGTTLEIGAAFELGYPRFQFGLALRKLFSERVRITTSATAEPTTGWRTILD
jgi:hypothetical protein